MKYFLMEQDKKSLEVPQIYNWSSQVDKRLLRPEYYHEIPQRTLLKGHFAPNTTFKEIILMPFILLPKEAAEVLQLFEPYIKFRDMPVMDVNCNRMHPYVFPLLKEYDCLSEQSLFNRDKSIVFKAVMRKDSEPDCVLFTLKETKGKGIIIREDYCEALLKRYIFGYTLKKIEVER